MNNFINVIKRVLFLDRTVYAEIKEGKSSILWALLLVYVATLLLSFFFLAHRLVPADNNLPICPGAGNKMMTGEYIKFGGITVSHLPILATERIPYQYILNCRPTDSTSAQLISDMLPLCFVGVLSSFSIIFYAVVLHIITHLLGGKSRYEVYLFAMCLTLTPFILLGSLLLVGKDVGYVGLAGAFLWSMICTIQATKEIKGLSYGKTIVAVFVASLIFFNLPGGWYGWGITAILLDQTDGDPTDYRINGERTTDAAFFSFQCGRCLESKAGNPTDQKTDQSCFDPPCPGECNYPNPIGVIISSSKAKEGMCYTLLDEQKLHGEHWKIGRARDDFGRVYDGVNKDLYGTIYVYADIRYKHEVTVCCKTDQTLDNKYDCEYLTIDARCGNIHAI